MKKCVLAVWYSCYRVTKKGLDWTPAGWNLAVGGLRQFCRAGEKLRCHGTGLLISPEGIAPAVNKTIFDVGDLWLLPGTFRISVLEHIFCLHSDQGPTFFSLKWKLLLRGASFVPLMLELMLGTPVEKQEQTWEGMLAEALCDQQSFFAVQCQIHLLPLLAAFMIVYRMVDLGQCTL